MGAAELLWCKMGAGDTRDRAIKFQAYSPDSSMTTISVEKQKS